MGWGEVFAPHTRQKKAVLFAPPPSIRINRTLRLVRGWWDKPFIRVPMGTRVPCSEVSL